MIITGIAATFNSPVGDHVLLPDAIDCSPPVPLCRDHNERIGEVFAMYRVGDKLFVEAETHHSAVGRSTTTRCSETIVSTALSEWTAPI